MSKSRELLACLVLLLVVLAPSLNVLLALPPLATATFPVGTIVVPMDDKQGDRIHVYGFIHEFLSGTPDAILARIIEPPDVNIQTGLTPSGPVYQGGPFLIEAKFQTAVSALLQNSTFTKVTVTQLTASFTSNQVFFVRQPTRILVIYGQWGRTDLTLSRMGISYTLVQPTDVLDNPSIINQYTLIVVDCPGWYGDGPSYEALHTKINDVYDTISARVKAGYEVIYTDIALLDLNATFPGYVQLVPGGSGAWASTIYNPPKGGSFSSEFPSQYYNPGPDANSVKIFTEGGGRVVSGVEPAHTSDVRIIMDSNQFGVPFRYAILGFYFQIGNGIVEGLAFHPYQQLSPPADENGYYAVYEMYGNKFVHGPQLDFLMSATPTPQTVAQGGVATYSVTVTSVGSFSSLISFQVSGLPSGSSSSFSPASVTPSEGGVASSTLTIPTSLSTPVGSYNLTITGTSTFPQITHNINVLLVVTPALADFVIDANPKKPTPLIVNLGQCGNITVSVHSIGNFSSPVNLTLSNLPTHVTSKYVPNPITPSPGGTVLSNLSICVGPNTTPNNYTMTVTGTSITSSPITHTVDVLLRVPTPTGPNFLIYLILLTALLVALGIGLLAVALSRKRGGKPRMGPPLRLMRRRPQVQYVLPLPTVRCRNCGRTVPLHSVYCPYCGRPQPVLPAQPPRMGAQVRRAGVGRKTGLGFALSLSSGILVMLNGALFLAPSFYGPPVNWSSIFWWLPTIGPSYAFAMGFIIGLVLLMGSIMILLGHGVIADLIIFPFAVFSLIVGGGFVAGMVLGIVGGIVGALKK